MWDINEPVVSSTPRAVALSLQAGDGAAVDADDKPSARRVRESYKSWTGLLRKVVWPMTDVSAFCCASDECYL